MEPVTKTVYIVTYEPEPEWEDEIGRWYSEEHIPALLGVPGYRSARRYIAVDGAPQYMQFYQIDSIDAFRSPERTRAIDTPWAERVRPHRTSRLTLYELRPAADVQMRELGRGLLRDGSSTKAALDTSVLPSRNA